MPRAILAAVALVLWILWCVLAVRELVPELRRHLLMWEWLMAYVLCLAPVIIVGIVLVLRERQTT